MNVLKRGEAGLELVLVDFTDRRVNNTKPLKYDLEVLKERFRALPLEQQGTLRDSAYHLEIPKSVFFEYTRKQGVFVAVTAAFKPKHTAWHRQQRIQFVQERKE
jgi:hypothetical protein